MEASPWGGPVLEELEEGFKLKSAWPEEAFERCLRNSPSERVVVPAEVKAALANKPSCTASSVVVRCVCDTALVHTCVFQTHDHAGVRRSGRHAPPPVRCSFLQYRH